MFKRLLYMSLGVLMIFSLAGCEDAENGDHAVGNAGKGAAKGDYDFNGHT